MTGAGTVMAHGGGAPEAAMIALPLLLFGTFLYLERRARRREAAEPEPAQEDPPSTNSVPPDA